MNSPTLKAAPVIAIVCGLLSVLLGFALDRTFLLVIGILILAAGSGLLFLRVNGGPMRWRD